MYGEMLALGGTLSGEYEQEYLQTHSCLLRVNLFDATRNTFVVTQRDFDRRTASSIPQIAKAKGKFTLSKRKMFRERQIVTHSTLDLDRPTYAALRSNDFTSPPTHDFTSI